MRFLLLDDEPFVLKILARQLENLGFNQTICIERAQDALNMLEHDINLCDIVLCDLQMPGMDGVEFVRHLVRLNYAGGLILISGEDERILHTVEKLARAHHLKVLGALHKPVSPWQLQRVLESSPNKPANLQRKIYNSNELQQQ